MNKLLSALKEDEAKTFVENIKKEDSEKKEKLLKFRIKKVGIKFNS